MPTITIHMPQVLGETEIDFYLFLRDTSSGALLNAGGDLLTESPANSGRFTATVSQENTTSHVATVYEGSTEDPDFLIQSGSLAANGTLVTDGDAASQASVDLILARISGASAVEVVSNVAAGGAVTLYVGDDHKVRSGTELEIPVSDVGGVLLAKLEAITTAYLYFGASRGTEAPNKISGTIADLTSSGTGADQLLIITVEITAAGTSCTVSDDYEYQIAQKQTQGAEQDDRVEISGTLELRRRRVAIP